MKKYILTNVAAMIGVAFAARGATINGTNYNLDSLTHKPISLLDGTALTSGGIIQIGSFTSADPGALIGGVTSPAGLAALLSDFIAFGSPTSVGASGAGFEGLYDVAAQSPLAAGHPLVGKSIYTWIGNGASLATSTQFAIIKDNNSFDIDAPLFAANAGLLETTNQYLFGSGNGPSLTANSVFPANVSLQLAGIPEPMSATLLLSGLVLLACRRRA
jgi:hypothetical protein